MNNTLASADDAELVRRALEGERSAVGEIYDRYANHIYSFCRSRLRSDADAADAMQDTFVRASTRLEQLRDPSKLRSWLFAIARNQIVVSGRATARATGGEGMELLASTNDDLDADLLRVEAAAQLWDASEGLSDRDQEVLELHVRHGLVGGELADALGVSESHCYVLLSRVKDRIASSLGGLLVARLGRDDCRELDQLLATWDGRFTIDIRSKVTRHIRSCDVCEQTHTTALASGVSFGVVPLISVPSGLRVGTVEKMFTALDVSKAAANAAGGGAAGAEQLAGNSPWDWKPDGFPTTLESHARPGVIWFKVAAAVAAIVMLVGVGGWFVNQSGSADELATVNDAVAEEAEVVSELASPAPTEPETTTTTTTEATTSTTEEEATGVDEEEIEPVPPTTVSETTTTESEPETVPPEEPEEEDGGEDPDPADEPDDDEEEDPEEPPVPANLPPVIVQVTPRLNTVQAARAGACEGERVVVGVEAVDPDGEVASVVLIWEPTLDATTTTALTSRQAPIWIGQIGPWLTPGMQSIRVLASDDVGATTETTFEVEVTACPLGFTT